MTTIQYDKYQKINRKYKSGDVVVIKSWKELKSEKALYPTIQPLMIPCCGESTTIEKPLNHSIDDIPLYHCNNLWTWRETWFESTEFFDDKDFEI